MPEEYELYPADEISKLKHDLESLKKHPLGKTAQGKNLLGAVEELNETMGHMMGLFKDAAEGMKGEESSHSELIEKMDGLTDKLDQVLDQNSKIASALIGVAEMIKEKPKKLKPIRKPTGPPTPGFGSPAAPEPLPPVSPPLESSEPGLGPAPFTPPPEPVEKPFGPPPLPTGPEVMPPPPPPKKKSFFSKFKR